MNFTIKFDNYENVYDDGYLLDNSSFLKLIGLCFKTLKFGKNL